MNHERPRRIFDGELVTDALMPHFKKAKQFVNEIPEHEFLEATAEHIHDHVMELYGVIPLELYSDQVSMDHEEIASDPPQTELRLMRFYILIPFTGHVGLWGLRPSTSSDRSLSAIIHDNDGDRTSGQLELVLEIPMDDLDDEGQDDDARRMLETTLSAVKDHVRWQRADVEKHNQSLSLTISECIDARRKRIEKRHTIAKGLNIPLKRRTDAPDLSQVPLKKRLVKPMPKKRAGVKDWAIPDSDYEYILKVIRHEGRTYETTPKTFGKHDEEELRDIILAHLNGHYEGDATGETFRNKGKTDLRIEADNRSAFIGECKVWRGAKEITEAVDQMLGYHTWRDCKSALIVFNKQIAGFLSIQKKLPDILKSHAKFVSDLNADQPGEWRLRFRSADDEDRLITIHVFLFNLYTKPTEKAKGKKKS